MRHKIFIGFDPRQPVALQVLMHSIYTRSSVPVSITPLVLSNLPIKRRGLTDFTFSRYLTPWLNDFEGQALFLDSDMMLNADIGELFHLCGDGSKSVFLVKNKLRFEWPSLMLFNNFHEDCKNLTPDFIETGDPHKFSWTDKIGELPAEWNHCVGYDDPNPNAKLIHFTAGIPCFEETNKCEFSKEWNKEAMTSTSSVSWKELMGNSVHAPRVAQGF